MGTDYGPWAPLPTTEITRLFQQSSLRWWVSGGVALELHLGHSWRDHEDADISILRRDAALLVDVLDGWDLYLAAAGVLTPWAGSQLSADRSENNIWCRPDTTSPWVLDVVISDGDDTEWIYRRDPTIRRPWREAVLCTSSGTPYLAPEIQLLFKSKNARPKDNVDAGEAIPRLDPLRRAWLGSRLPADHEWQQLAQGSGSMVELRQMRIDDVELLAAWDHDADVAAALGGPGAKWYDWPTELAREVAWRELLIAEENGRPVGFVQLTDAREEESHYWGDDVSGDVWAIDIWLGSPTDRGRGLGSQLMRLACERCFDRHGAKSVLVDPKTTNQRAITFYRKLGFRPVSERYLDGEDSFVMRLDHPVAPD